MAGQRSDLPRHTLHQSSHGRGRANDKVVQGTDNDASVSRLSAVELGYLVDPFAHSLTPPGDIGTRRYPIINRGPATEVFSPLRWWY